MYSLPQSYNQTSKCKRCISSNAYGKTTPKFERAKSLQTGDCCMMYLSGTAAIRGEVSLAEADVVAQLRITLENIRHLIGDVSMKLLRVYH